MDISSLSMVISQSKVQEAASTSILKMSMDSSEEAVNKLVENMAVDPSIGTNIDTVA